MTALDDLWDFPEWRNRAECRGMDDLFVPRGAEGGGTLPGTHEKIARARSICRRCPVQAECLEYALTCGGGGGPAKEGVWAGRTPDELRAIVRRRKVDR